VKGLNATHPPTEESKYPTIKAKVKLLKRLVSHLRRFKPR
jgi:hypothetical protein